MAYKVIILYRLYMPSYFLGTFTEYPILRQSTKSTIRKFTTINTPTSSSEKGLGCIHIFFRRDSELSDK